MESWLRGVGAAAIDNLMEDAATAEICRAQVWQWRRHGARLAGGRTVTGELVHDVINEETAKLRAAVGAQAFDARPFAAARDLFARVALGEPFAEFFTTTHMEAGRNEQ
jgi:malate synthase